jgi:hypothetical protein
MPVPITAYAFTWSIATKKGAIHLQAGGRAFQLPVTSVEELAALGTLLRGVPGLQFEFNGQTLAQAWMPAAAGGQAAEPQARVATSQPASQKSQGDQVPTARTVSQVRLFISHSSEDSTITARVVELMKVALNLPAALIRCTSLEGYRLAGGANTDDQLRLEVHDAAAFVGIVSAASLKSLYVLFELGARWGAGLPVVPLLTRDVAPSQLSGPLASLNSLRADDPTALHQLVSEVGFNLKVTPEPPAVYHQYIERIVAAQQVGPGGRSMDPQM